MGILKLSCGCQFDTIDRPPEEILETDQYNYSIHPKINIDVYNIRKDCGLAWNLISEGNTLGIFQLESHLGKLWAKKLKPESIEETASLVSLLRPGCLEAKDAKTGKTLTSLYVERKHGTEETKVFHKAIEDVLKNTYQIIVFQEEAMQIAVNVAGFSLEDADSLRKAAGKKIPELMAEVKTKFLEGCKKQKIVNKEEAEEIFNWIEASQRYSFNKCLSPNTLVQTKNEYKTLDDISIGETIKTPEGYCEILDKINGDEKELYEVTLESGKTIECTLEHQFLCEDYKKIPLVEIFRENLKILCENRKIKGNHIQTERIVSIKPIGRKKTIDLEINNKSHTFFANGIATSNSHAIAYSIHTYWTAYLKSHFPLQFYCSYLWGSKFKPDQHEEISNLINDAKFNDIIINPPSLPRLNDVPVIHNKEIYYSLGSIRQIGDKALAKLIKTTKETENFLNKVAEDWDWLDFLLYLSPQNNIAAMIALIQSGSLDYLKVQRSKMLFELKDIWIKLTEKEQQWCKTQYNNYRECELHELLNECARPRKEGGGCSNINRIRIVGDLSSLCEKPPYELKDSLDSIIWGESQYLGIPMSAHATDKYEDSMVANTTCKELLKSPREYSVLSVQIKDIREVKTKRGKNPGQRMAFMVVEDSTSQIDGIVVFPDQYKEYENFLEIDNVILLRLEKSKKGSHILKKAQILE